MRSCQHSSEGQVELAGKGISGAGLLVSDRMCQHSSKGQVELVGEDRIDHFLSILCYEEVPDNVAGMCVCDLT